VARAKKKSQVTFLNDPMLVVGLLFLIFALLTLNRAYGRTANNLGNPLPIGLIAPSPVGIVYPSFNSAAGVNPAALALGKKLTSLQLAGAPSLQAGDSTTYLASLATTTKNTGWSLGYDGTSGSGSMTHGIFAGVGFKLDPVSLGLGLRGTISSGFNPNVDAGLRFAVSQNVTVAAVARSLDSTLQAGGGIGINNGKNNNVEISYMMPATTGGSALVTFGATVYTGNFGAIFQSSYYLSSKTFTHTLGALYWLASNFNLTAQLTTPRTMNLGITYTF
jgi:hypothetical protein